MFWTTRSVICMFSEPWFGCRTGCPLPVTWIRHLTLAGPHNYRILTTCGGDTIYRRHIFFLHEATLKTSIFGLGRRRCGPTVQRLQLSRVSDDGRFFDVAHTSGGDFCTIHAFTAPPNNPPHRSTLQLRCSTQKLYNSAQTDAATGIHRKRGSRKIPFDTTQQQSSRP